MVNGIATEILLPNEFIDHSQTIETIYFGGGTPSILSTSCIIQLLLCIEKKFTITASPEITLEANPDDITAVTLLN